MVALTCVPTDLYDHVYGFLLDNGLPKTAKKFKSEVAQIVKKPSGPGLVEIFATFFNSGHGKNIRESEQAQEAVADDANVQKSEPEIKSKKKKKRKQGEEAALIVPKKAKIDADVSNGPEVLNEEANKPEKSKKEKKKKKQAPQEEQNENIADEPHSVVPAEATNNEKTKKDKKKKKKKSTTEPTAEESTNATENHATENATESATDNVTDDVTEKLVSDQVEAKEEIADTTNTKTEREEVSHSTDTHENEFKSPGTQKSKKKQKKGEKNAPFRRVVSEEVEVPDVLQDNSFDAKINAQGDWGEKANNDLRFTRGKSFRHEKTKKKRGSYKGGAINTSVSSIKFDDSDEE